MREPSNPAVAAGTAASLAGRCAMTRPDPDAIADTLAGVVGRLAKDPRTTGLALRLDDIRRDVGRALAADATPRKMISEAALQAQMQGAADRTLLPA